MIVVHRSDFESYLARTSPYLKCSKIIWLLSTTSENGILYNQNVHRNIFSPHFALKKCLPNGMTLNNKTFRGNLNLPNGCLTFAEHILHISTRHVYCLEFQSSSAFASLCRW